MGHSKNAKHLTHPAHFTSPSVLKTSPSFEVKELRVEEADDATAAKVEVSVRVQCIQINCFQSYVAISFSTDSRLVFVG